MLSMRLSRGHEEAQRHPHKEWRATASLLIFGCSATMDLRSGSASCGPIYDASGVGTALLGLFSEITDRKLAEATLRESEERFRNMADCAPVLIWMSGHDKLRDFFNQG